MRKQTGGKKGNGGEGEEKHGYNRWPITDYI